MMAKVIKKKPKIDRWKRFVETDPRGMMTVTPPPKPKKPKKKSAP